MCCILRFSFHKNGIKLYSILQWFVTYLFHLPMHAEHIDSITGFSVIIQVPFFVTYIKILSWKFFIFCFGISLSCFQVAEVWRRCRGWGERWSKPYVATLSLHSLFELRSCLINGTVLLDMRANSIEEISGKIRERKQRIVCGVMWRKERRMWLFVLGQVTYLPDLSTFSSGMDFFLPIPQACSGMQMTWSVVFHLPVCLANIIFYLCLIMY